MKLLHNKTKLSWETDSTCHMIRFTKNLTANRPRRSRTFLIMTWILICMFLCDFTNLSARRKSCEICRHKKGRWRRKDDLIFLVKRIMEHFHFSIFKSRLDCSRKKKTSISPFNLGISRVNYRKKTSRTLLAF